MKSYAHFARWAYEQPWALTPRMVDVVQGLLAERVAGNIPSPEIIAGRIAEERELRAATARRGTGGGGSVAVLPIYGVLMQRADMLSEMSGAASVDSLSKQFQQMVADPAVGSIVLDIDSPGGGVYGIAEFADEVYAARGQKRIVAVANSMAASAAYWIATAADELVITPGGEAGSIGVYMLHQDWSAAYEQAGVKATLIKYGENKAEGIETEPLSDSAREHLQGRVDAYGEMFTAAVAKGRGVSKATVERDFGQGRVFGAKDAVALKMADRVGTLGDVLGQLTGRAGKPEVGRAKVASSEIMDAMMAAFGPGDPVVDIVNVSYRILPEATDEAAPSGRSARDAEARYRYGRLTRPGSA